MKPNKTTVTIQVQVKHCLSCHHTSDLGSHGFCENCGSKNVMLDTVAVNYNVDNSYDDYDIPGVDVNAPDADTRGEVFDD